MIAIDRVLDLYAVFGKSEKIAAGFRSVHRCPGWTNPIMTPILTKNFGVPNEAQCNELNVYFAKIKTRKSPWDHKIPYFNVVSNNKIEKLKLTELAADRGYHPIYQTISLCSFNHVREFKLPKDITVTFAEYFHPESRKIISEEIKNAFHQEDLFISEFEYMFRRTPGTTYSVLLWNSKNQIVASGLFTLADSKCCLWSGSVREKFRGRGLSRLSVEIRKAISAGLGAKHWFYFTQSPLMNNYYDSRVHLEAFQKVRV